jgi:putative peptidoglycan binding protein
MEDRSVDRSIQQPVGDGSKAKNLSDDVVTIQQLLNDITPQNGGSNPPLKVDGLCGHKTKTAIQGFQLKHFGWKLADARVDPDGATLKKMNEMAAVEEYRSLGFRMRRLQADSEDVPSLQPQIFLVQYLEGASRNAIYTFSAGQVSANPGAYPPAWFKGEWNAFMTRSPASIRELGCKARQGTSAIITPTTPWGPPDDYYKVSPGHVMEFYLAAGTIYVPVTFETEVEMWGTFDFAGEAA